MMNCISSISSITVLHNSQIEWETAELLKKSKQIRIINPSSLCIFLLNWLWQMFFMATFSYKSGRNHSVSVLRWSRWSFSMVDIVPGLLEYRIHPTVQVQFILFYFCNRRQPDSIIIIWRYIYFIFLIFFFFWHYI